MFYTYIISIDLLAIFQISIAIYRALGNRVSWYGVFLERQGGDQEGNPLEIYYLTLRKTKF